MRYDFAARFAPFVASGEKTSTIRAPRLTGHARPGDRLRLYAFRPPLAREGGVLLARATCVSTSPIRVADDGAAAITLNGDQLEPHECEIVAAAEGFADPRLMLAWLRAWRGLPFDGVLIQWRVEG